MTSSSAVLRWTDGSVNGDPIRMYTIEGRTNWNHTWSSLGVNITAKEVDRLNSRKEAQLINAVSPYSTYEFRLAAANSVGYGPFSEPSPQYNTRPDRIYKAPNNVGGGGGKTGDLTITWTPFVGQEQNASGTYYKVFWRRLAGENQQEVTEESEYQSQIVKHSRSAGLFVVTVDRNRRYYYTPYKVKGRYNSYIIVTFVCLTLILLFVNSASLQRCRMWSRIERISYLLGRRRASSSTQPGKGLC